MTFFKLKFVSYCISTEKVFVLHKEQYKLNLEEVKLILRPLIDSEITKEEYKYIWEELNTTAQMLKDDIKMKPELFLYLIKQGFDLFGLLQSHQAIRK